MFAHSYSKLSHVLRWVNAICPPKKVQFWDGCRLMMMAMMKHILSRVTE